MNPSIGRSMRRAAIALPCLVMVQDTCAAPSLSKAQTKAKLVAAALAAQRDTDPALNGSICSPDVPPSMVALHLAAEAARRDQDPLINGAIGPLGRDGDGRQPVAKR